LENENFETSDYYHSGKKPICARDKPQPKEIKSREWVGIF
jgi:hypothetical protein